MKSKLSPAFGDISVKGRILSVLCLSIIYGNDLAAIAQPKHTRYGLGTDKQVTHGVPKSMPDYCISLIAPYNGGRTIFERPALYIYIYKRENARTFSKSHLGIDFRIREDKYLRRTIFRGKEKILGEGFYKIMLPISNSSILNGKIQRFSVFLFDEGDLLYTSIYNSNAYIRRDPDINLEQEVKRENTLLGKARIYAKYFYWYDAFDAYTQWLEVNPSDQIARGERAKLLQESLNQCVNHRYISPEESLKLIDTRSAKPIVFPQKKDQR